MKKLSLVALSTLCTLCVYAQTLQSVTDAPNGNSTTKNIWVGMAPVAGVTENTLNLGGKMKLLGAATTYTLGLDGAQPTIYRSGVNGLTYPFDSYDNLILQAGIVNKDLVIVTGNTPTPRMVVKGNGNVGIGNTTPRYLLHTTAYNNTGTTGAFLWGEYYGSLIAVPNSSSNYYAFHVASNVNADGTDGTGGAKSLLYVRGDGNVGIGTSSPGTYKLAVEGTIGARKVKVTQQATWADFVFQDDYKLRTLPDLEKYIQQNKRLPDIPSEKEVQQNGIDLGDMNAKLLQKVEELTLYIIELNKKHESAITELHNKQQTLESRIAEMGSNKK